MARFLGPEVSAGCRKLTFLVSGHSHGYDDSGNCYPKSFQSIDKAGCHLGEAAPCLVGDSGV